jgi:RNA polymerase sigma factor (TIGR02999 family)
MEAPEGAVTRLLDQWRGGSDDALNELMPLVYSELHRIAERHLVSERESPTLQATMLIHEAYMKLVGANVEWEGRKHFLAIASKNMRRVLVDHARSRSRVKRGGPDAVSVTLTNAIADQGSDQVDIIAVDVALEKLAAFDKRRNALLRWTHLRRDRRTHGHLGSNRAPRSPDRTILALQRTESRLTP